MTVKIDTIILKNIWGKGEAVSFSFYIR